MPGPSDDPSNQPPKEQVQRAGLGSDVVTTVRVAQDVPLIFADGLSSHSFGNGMSKMYLYRTDPDPTATVKGPGAPVHVLQLVMPNTGFLEMLSFLEHRARVMVKAGGITQTEVDSARAIWPPEAANVAQ